MQQNENLYKLPLATKLSTNINPLVEKCIQQMKCSDLFNNKTLPYMIQIVEQLLLNQPAIPLCTTITLTRTIVFGLLSMMYFGLCLPQKFGDLKFPSQFNLAMCQGTQLEKLKCFINYFNQCANSPEYFTMPDLKIEKLKGELKFSENKLSDFSFEAKKNEDHTNCGLVDFSDKFFGGKVAASRGCAQEEVLLLLNPEAVVATLLISQVQDDEALQISGILQFNDYRGYEDSFVCIPQKYQDKNQILIAIDALYLASKPHNYQYSKEAILREIRKAYVGFQNQQIISTGKWGCGLYGGDKQLKTLIQWIAFSLANPNGKIIFNGLDDKAYNNLGQRFELIRKRYMTVDKLMNELLKVSTKNVLDRL